MLGHRRRGRLPTGCRSASGALPSQVVTTISGFGAEGPTPVTSVPDLAARVLDAAARAGGLSHPQSSSCGHQVAGGAVERLMRDRGATPPLPLARCAATIVDDAIERPSWWNGLQARRPNPVGRIGRRSGPCAADGTLAGPAFPRLSTRMGIGRPLGSTATPATQPAELRTWGGGSDGRRCRRRDACRCRGSCGGWREPGRGNRGPTDHVPRPNDGDHPACRPGRVVLGASKAMVVNPSSRVRGSQMSPFRLRCAHQCAHGTVDDAARFPDFGPVSPESQVRQVRRTSFRPTDDRRCKRCLDTSCSAP